MSVIDRILGYWVTSNPDTLARFIGQAREGYIALEQALEPISRVIASLETDRTPRAADFWQVQAVGLVTLRQATQAALQLFAKERSSQAAPVPLIVSATSIGYTCPLHYLESKINDAALLITAHKAARTSTSEATIRLLQALREVVKAGREAISKGRANLDTAPQEQQQLTAPRPARKTTPQPEQPTTPVAVRKTGRPALYIVRREDAT